MKLAAVLLAALAAFAQPTPQIRGSVVEQGPNSPLAGAEVRVLEVADPSDEAAAKLLGTIFTDAKGAFAFQPPRLGLFLVEIRKAGYTSSRVGSEGFSQRVVLNSERPRFEMISVSFMMPGSLTGRVVDAEGKPVVDLRVYVQAAATASIGPSGKVDITDAQGNFTVSDLPPGGYVVSIAPQSIETLSVVDSNEATFPAAPDFDQEAALWPGGRDDPRDVVPVQVQPGAPANVGTITLRTVPYYRARVQSKGECPSRDMWHYVIMKLPYNGRADELRRNSGPCHDEFVIRNLAAGSYLLSVWTGKEAIRWAQTPLRITHENVEASLNFSASADLTARVIIPSGVASPSLANVRLQLRGENTPPTGSQYMFNQGDAGQFSISNVPWMRHALTVNGIPVTHYIKEVRYAGQPVDQMLSIAPGGQLEIVLDDHPAMLRGTIQGVGVRPDLTLVLLDREPRRAGTSLLNEPFSYMAPVRPDASYQFAGLAPGDYRIKALAANDRVINSTALSAIGGQLIHISTGETKTVDLPLE